MTFWNKKFAFCEIMSIFAIPKRDDSLAQQVEHNTFNVGVLGSSPRRITRENFNEVLSFFMHFRTQDPNPFL